MSPLIPSNLFVKIIPSATAIKPVEGRKYTLTHSDFTGKLYLSIGTVYEYDAINSKTRDEVLAEWVPQMGQYSLLVSAYVSGGEFDESYTKIRFMIFKKEMELALSTIIAGDYPLFLHYPWLLNSPIYVNFDSHIPKYNQSFYYGTPRKYLTSNKELVKQN